MDLEVPNQGSTEMLGRMTSNATKSRAEETQALTGETSALRRSPNVEDAEFASLKVKRRRRVIEVSLFSL